MSFSRRRFLHRLGLTAAGSPLLYPIARSLVSDAHAAAARRCFVVFVVGETIPILPPLGFVPEGIEVGTGKAPMENYGAVDQPIAKLPSMFAPLEPFRSKIALVDGLHNLCGVKGEGALATQHGTGFGVITGLPVEGNTNEYGGGPTGISLDQAIARVIGKTPLTSINIGFSGREPADQTATTFSSGPGQPIAHIGRPSLLYGRLLGNKGTASSNPGDEAARAGMQKRLLDSMRDDVRRLQAELAGEERGRLEEYLKAISEYDEKQTQLAQVRGSLDCGTVPAGVDGTPEQRLESMFRMATLSLKCGLTNVVGVSVGHGFTHDDLQLMKGTYLTDGYGGHGRMGDYSIYRTALNRIYGAFSKLTADMLNALGPLASQTVFMFVSGSGATVQGHHAWVRRFPCLVYDGTGTLKTGGRYLRYARGERSVLDLYASVAHAAGAPMDRFNSSTYNVAKGPLEALMA